MGIVSRKLLTNGFRLFDLLLMVFGFALAAWPAPRPLLNMRLGELLGLRVRLGQLLLFFAFLVIWHLIFKFYRLYGSKRLSSRWDEVQDILKATTLGALLIATLGVAAREPMMDRSFLVVFWVVTTVTCVLSRMAIRSLLSNLRRHGRNSRNMVVVGTNARALAFVDGIHHRPELGYRILGFADDDWHGLDELRAAGHKIVSDLTHLPDFLRLNVVDEVVLALPLRSYHGLASAIASACEQQGIIVRFLPNIFDLKEARQTTDDFEGHAVISHESTSADTWGLAVKRLLDIVLSSLAIIILSPVLVFTAILVKLTAPGPVFFVQRRLGLNKRMFNIYKFRTMVVDAEKRLKDIEHLNEVSGPVFKIKNDPRITPIGRFLRKTSIDELPQLFNVLKGDMSLVGPRPLQVRDYELFNSFCEDWQRRRFSVRPGITCLWQIKGRSSIPFEKWMELDLQYVRNWSLWLDLEILAKTVPAVLKGSGAA
jgi:exopolysaccharide biosynthesis polyprenyl glycosylphosphotransferase